MPSMFLVQKFESDLYIVVANCWTTFLLLGVVQEPTSKVSPAAAEWQQCQGTPGQEEVVPSQGKHGLRE